MRKVCTLSVVEGITNAHLNDFLFDITFSFFDTIIYFVLISAKQLFQNVMEYCQRESMEQMENLKAVLLMETDVSNNNVLRNTIKQEHKTISVALD